MTVEIIACLLLFLFINILVWLDEWRRLVFWTNEFLEWLRERWERLERWLEEWERDCEWIIRISWMRLWLVRISREVHRDWEWIIRISREKHRWLEEWLVRISREVHRWMRRRREVNNPLVEDLLEEFCISTSVHEEIKSVVNEWNYSWSNICCDLSGRDFSQHPCNNGFTRHSIRELTMKSIKTDDTLGRQLCITYTDYEDRMTDSHPLFNKTMEDRSNPRVPSTFVVGNRVVIELRSSTQRNQEKLNSLVDYLQNKRGILTLLDTSDIVYSVTGDIPLSHMVNKFNLTRENLNSLIKFTNKQFFEENLASRELLQISTRPINLKKYFGPLLKRIIEIRNLVRERNNEYFKNFIDIVVNEIMSRIEVAANNQNHLKYLQDVYTSFIFNTREMSAYMDELMSLINEDKIKSKIVGNSEKVIQSKFRKDWNVSIHLRVTISLTKAFQILERNLNFTFNRKEFSVDKCQMIKCFTDAINQELSIVSSDIRTIMCERQSYETFLKRRIGMEILLDTSVTGNHSHVGLYFYSNQTEASIPCPILTRPKMVTMVEATDTSINIKWKFKDDSQVTSYKVHYRRCVSSSDSGSSTTTANQYYSFDTDNKCLTANVTNIAPGEYIFIVQAQFNDVLGIPSHESEPISTLNYDALNDQSIYCPICHDETKNFALVPCGHVFGENCVRRLNRCPFCALVIERRLKLYNN